ncbi:uncharacterized protein LOC117650509 isoform X1 [Thrips palmi]|uniref:Uncharacterized protein LOC117650509 isoform X1 n=1 Tax=Thrips palmi TaxID=161013 RepID=A0A6P8ZYN5_THRPL|nr:uncharacterized protein LOC117650509 isoform X1 [Thrips palmi]
MQARIQRQHWCFFVWAGTLLLAFNHVQGKYIQSFSGPYIMFLRSMTSCPSDGTVDLHVRVTHFKPSRPFDLQILTANLSLKMDVEDNFWLYGDMAKRANNQWKENALKWKFPNVGCSAIRAQAPGVFSLISKATGASADKNERCFIPKGDFHVTGPLNLTLPNFPILVYARDRVHVQARQDPKSPVWFCAVRPGNWPMFHGVPGAGFTV